MSESVITARPDLDIAYEIEDVMYQYPPLSHDRHHVQMNVSGGGVVLSGNVKTPITRRYLVEQVQHLDGVVTLNAEGLYDDETMRLEVAKLMPLGIFMRIEFGVVQLTGSAPAGTTADDLAAQIAVVPGVRRVISRLHG